MTNEELYNCSQEELKTPNTKLSKRATLLNDMLSKIRSLEYYIWEAKNSIISNDVALYKIETELTTIEILLEGLTDGPDKID